MKKFFYEENLNSRSLDEYEEICDLLNDNQVDGAFFAGFPFIVDGDKTIAIRGLIVSFFGILIFCESKSEENLYNRKITQLLLNSDNLSNIIFSGSNLIAFSNNDKLSDTSEYIKRKRILKENDVREVIGLLQNILKLNDKDNRTIKNKNSLGSKIVKRSKIEANLDERQFKLIYQDNSTHLRIRGLAGSGKTILLVKKMAFLHFKNKDLDIAYVFFTKSLKQTIDNLFIRFYREFDQYGGEPDMDKIHIMYSWGGKEQTGLYSLVCNKLKIQSQPYSPFYPFELICKETFESISTSEQKDSVRMFDYLIIDEAQDFKLNFFKMAKATLKPFGKIFYAYDELQSLNESSEVMPSKEEIFEYDQCKDVNLKECYRSSKEIIVTAHALGLGVYHKSNNEIEYINVIEDPSVWEATGYNKESGEFSGNSIVTLSRETVINDEIDNVIETKVLDFSDQITDSIKEIVRLIKDEDVKPEDILIIDLNSLEYNDNFVYYKAKAYDYLQENGLNQKNGKRLFEMNIVNKDRSYEFKVADSVSYTTIFRAKGNEANIVFILNTNTLDSALSFNRNKIFTAMTRAKFKVYLYGIGKGMESLVDEINSVKENDYKLVFKYPTAEEFAQYKSKIYSESVVARDVEKMISKYRNDPNLSTVDLIKLLFEESNDEDKRRIQEYLKNGE